MASNDLLVKKLACWFLSQHCNDETTVLLAINTLLKDCRDANPMVRGLALRTLTGLPHRQLLQYSLPAVIQGLQDNSAYVRRIAVAAVPALHKLSSSDVLDSELLDQLYGLIRDNDPLVTVNCLTTLDMILAGEGGVVINKNISGHLLKRLATFTDWGLITIFKLLCKFRPKTDDLILEYMNTADEYLRHSNTAVAQQALQYFLHLIVNMPHLHSQIHTRTMETLLNKLNSGNHEITYALLDIIESVLPTFSDLFRQKYKLFFCKYNEPVYLKKRRLQLLPRLADKENEASVLEELELYCHDGSAELCHKALEGIACMSQHSDHMRRGCLAVFIKLLQMDVEHIILGVLQVLQQVPFGDGDEEQTIFQLLLQVNKRLRSTADKCSLLWLVGEHCAKMPSAPYILEEVILDIDSFSPNTCIACLSAAIKVFVHLPAQTQMTLSHVMEVGISHKNQRVREKAVAYYHMLQQDPSMAITLCDN